MIEYYQRKIKEHSVIANNSVDTKEWMKHVAHVRDYETLLQFFNK